MLSANALVSPATATLPSLNTVVRAPLYGVVSGVAGGSPPTTADVLWQNGEHVTAIPVDALDELTNAAAQTAAFLGRVVNINAGGNLGGPEFKGVMIGSFLRVPGGTGTPTAPRVVVQSLTVPGLVYEVPAAFLYVVKGG